MSFSQITNELLYGNTFSDIRDGAYILKGFEQNTNGQFVYGKTYLAALFSFVPSSFSTFRYDWSWGRYTTTGLFGYHNHFGLRGGNAMEAYINFSWLGVIFIAIIQGLIFSKLEKVFHEIFIKESYCIEGKEFFVFYILFLIYGVFSASSSAYNIYTLIALIVLLVLFSGALKKS